MKKNVSRRNNKAYKNRNKKNKNIFSFVKNKGFIICIVGLILAFVWFSQSDYWPFPSQEKINERFSKIIDACMYNEQSGTCKNLQKKYKMTFEYCHYLGEIPKINESPSVYSVVKKEGFKAKALDYDEYSTEYSLVNDNSFNATGLVEPESETEYKRIRAEKLGDSIYPYYGCVSNIDDLGTSNSENLIKDPTTIALFGLSKMPSRKGTGNKRKCTSNNTEFNLLWEQIPDSELVKKEYDTAFKTFNWCSQLSSLNKEYDRINKKISDYANNKTIQLFYQAYDEWNTMRDGGCTWYEKSFKQYCGAAVGSDEKNESSYKRRIEFFVKEMKQYKDTDYFLSRAMLNE